MIKFKINGSEINYPSAWEDLTFNQYLKVLQFTNDTIQMISAFSGLEYDYLKSATIINLEALLEASKFILQAPAFETYYPQVGKYKLPQTKTETDKDRPQYGKKIFDIRFETMGQFEDMRAAMMKQGDVLKHTEAYGRYVAIYLQKIRDGAYDPSKVPDMEEEVKQMPACEVIAVGQFFFLKLYSLSTGTAKTFPPTPLNPKKSKPVLTSSAKSSGNTRKSTKSRGR